MAARGAARGGDGEAARRPRLHRPGRRAHHAAPALRLRSGARDGREDLRSSCAIAPTAPRASSRRSAAPSRCSTRDLYLSGGKLRRRACPRSSRTRSARTACATRTCFRSRPPEPSASPSPTTPRTASSRRSRGPTRARSAWPTARMKEFRVEDHAWRLYQATCGGDAKPAAPTSSPRSRFPADAHEEMVAAVAPFIDTSISKTVNVPGGLSVRGFRGPLHRGVEVGVEGPRHLSAQQRDRARCSRRIRARNRAARRIRHRRPQPPPRDQVAAAAGAHEPALARPPGAAGGQPRRGPT